VITIFEGNELIGRTIANLPRRDIVKHHPEFNVLCGFEWDFDQPVQDVRKITIDPDDTGQALKLGRQAREFLGEH
jgi:hypothetical protein